MSSLFNLKLPLPEKPQSIHPWQCTIKDILSHRIKHAHNSVRNPCYPKIKEKIPDDDQVKFTVIGDRVTKEFIYCVNLVQGLHKYRWKKFDVPTIRGVTSVEWADVWGSLKLQYGGFAHCLKSKVAILINDKFLGGENELKQLVETKYIYHIVLNYRSEAVANFAGYIRCSGLFADIVPFTCENFLRLCRDTKGGYSGTPIHRIVKDGWVQGGGFGLKSAELECENFIIPHDRRGVLAMANDGRHIDCSTQFFVLLQPAPWMAHKYVAFGQLIEGNETLNKIEGVPTWYESPMSNITIYKAGILNMECQDIMINRGANEYISGHIEDLNALGDLLIEALIERVFLEIELKEVERLAKELLGEHEETIDDGAGHLHATQRFIRKKDEMEKHIQTQSKTAPAQGTKSPAKVQGAPSQSLKAQVTQSQSQKSQIAHSQSQKSQMMAHEAENNEFDVEEYEPEETDYKHISLAATVSLIVKPEIPYYIPLTDVPYPGEIDSIYDLKKFLKGHYCLETDLEIDIQKTPNLHTRRSYPSELFEFLDEQDEISSSESLDSEDEKEIRQYLRDNVERVSFAGGIVKSIGRGTGKYNLFEDARKSELICDDHLRRLRLASVDIKYREEQEKKVSISVPTAERTAHSTKIKRRQTGFVRQEDLEKIRVFKSDHDISHGDDDDDDDDDELDSRKVRIAPSAISAPAPPRPLRRPTGFVRPSDIYNSDTDMPRQSVLQRLYQDVSCDDDEGPTLKDYRPISESHQKSMMLTFSPNSRIRDDEDEKRGKFLRHSITADNMSYEQVLNLQHSKKVARKISSDYVKTIDQIEHRVGNSLRSIEFAKTRPSMRVSEYQLKNQKYQEEMRASKLQMKLKKASETCDRGKKKGGIRLPGDTPLYSMVEMQDTTRSKIF